MITYIFQYPSFKKNMTKKNWISQCDKLLVVFMMMKIMYKNKHEM
jgi:hypothetical protein